MINKKKLSISFISLFVVFSFYFFISPSSTSAFVSCAGPDQCANDGYFNEGCIPLNSSPCGSEYSYCSDNPGGGNVCGGSTCWQGTICDGVVDEEPKCEDQNAENYGSSLPCVPAGPGSVCETVGSINYQGSLPCIPPTINAPSSPGCACTSAGICILDASRCSITEVCGDGRTGPGEQCDLGAANSNVSPADCSESCTLNSWGTCELTDDGKPAQYFSNNPADFITYSRRLETNVCYATNAGDDVESLCYKVAPSASVQGVWREADGQIDGFSEYLTIGQWACDSNNTAGIGPGNLYFQMDINGDVPDDNEPTYKSRACIRKYSCLIDNNPSSNGACGTAARTYPQGAVSYGSYTFCSSGNPTTVIPAFPSAGNTSSWYCGASGSGSPSPQCVAVNPATTVVGPITEVSLIVVKSPTIGGSVSSNDGKISCGNDCSEVYDSGTVVGLTATPSSSYWRFSGWAGSCSGVGQCILTISGAQKTVQANFAPRLFDYKEF